VRTTTVTCQGTAGADQVEVVSGISGLVLLSSTGSEFRGFAKDAHTTLPETDDRILCTSVEARWRHAQPQADWASSYDAVRDALTRSFADTYSRSLQETLYAMGERVVATCHGVVEVRLRLPNVHHLLVDLGPFGLDNPNQVFHVDDRPYGLIEGTVLADGHTADGGAW
jgi:urate oxidase